MHYHALAVDYDGTLATNGRVDEKTIEALHRLRDSGRRLVLVTGRIVDQLLDVFPQIGLCNLVVTDNGAVLYDPATDERTPLTERPPINFIHELSRRGVPELEIGDVIVATWEPHETTVLQTIRDMSLELQIIFNKGAVMILPTGVNKATGLHAALQRLGLSRHNTVGIGDAENDEAFLKFCDTSAAVENALAVVKERVDIVTTSARSAGVTELIDQILENDLRKLHYRAGKGILLGHDLHGNEFRLPVYGTRVLVTGEPAGGKSKFALTMLEQLMENDYQTCIVDPEGDYHDMQEPIVLGTLERPPGIEDVIEVLHDPAKSCVVSLFGAKHDEQPALFAKLLRAIMEYRGSFGRPHWYVIDEAHYPLSKKWEPVGELPLSDLRSVMHITAFLDQLPETVLELTDLVVAIGDDPRDKLAEFCKLLNEPMPQVPPPVDGKTHHALAWWRGKSDPAWFVRLPSKIEHQRHRHGYLDGDMDEEHRFYFRGPKGELNLPAQNLRMFMQLGEGVDDDTWLYHLRKGHYDRWFRDVIQDDDLAEWTVSLRNNGIASAAKSREQLFDYIRQKYEQQA